MKKLMCGILVVVVLATFAACGGNSNDPIVGDWTFTAASMMGMEVTVDDMSSMGIDMSGVTMNYSGNGKVTLTLPEMFGDDSGDFAGKWSNEGDNTYLIDDGEEQMSLTLSSDQNELVLDYEGMTMTFAKK